MGKGTTDTFPRRAACSSPGKNLLTPHYSPVETKACGALCVDAMHYHEQSDVVQSVGSVMRFSGTVAS